MPLQDGSAGVVGKAPETYGAVSTPRGECGAVWRASKGLNYITVPHQDGGAGIVGKAPQTDGLVAAARSEGGTVRRASDGHDAIDVPPHHGGTGVVGIALVRLWVSIVSVRYYYFYHTTTHISDRKGSALIKKRLILLNIGGTGSLGQKIKNGDSKAN